MKRIVWIGCGALLLAGALWFGLRDHGSPAGQHLAPVEAKSGPVSGKSRHTTETDQAGSRGGRDSGPPQPEPMSAAERLVLEGKSSPEMVAAVAKASALVPRFKQLLQLPQEKADDVITELVDEVSSLPVITDDLANSIRDALLAAGPGAIDYATSALEEQGTPVSAGLLADLLRHPNEEVRDSALTALEGIAGDVFDTPQQAENWARNWKLTPQELSEALGEVASETEIAIPGAGVPVPAVEDPPPSAGQ